jgi:hypothetical protein
MASLNKRVDDLEARLQDGTPIVIPANRDGYVGFYAMPDTTIPVTWVRLYFNAMDEDSGTPAEVSCGFTPVKVAAGN